ncbi:MraY family glycosyltransferase [Ideonella margarita]|uniref:Glycosyltransferase n=1 Tax=Ideonella margarita TaxID=2984191 RepID=A0ABU9C411_9BURK
MVLAKISPDTALQCIQIALCATPAFASGIVEDITKNVSPRRRLFAALISGLMAYFILNIHIPSPEIEFLKGDLASIQTIAIVFITIFFVSGVVHAVNIIDGMNGLASMSVIAASTGIFIIAKVNGDVLVAGLALACSGAVLGFFVWNYPRGIIFLGDGGAYLLGFWVASLGLLLINRNQSVSVVSPMLLMAYPLFETLFTMYRRHFLQGRSISRPDGMHLHTLIYRRKMRWSSKNVGNLETNTGNARTSPPLWLINMIAVVPAIVWWDNTAALLIASAAFAAAYLLLYWRIVSFKTPYWLRHF